jgi:hypothetical protein
LCLVIVVPQNPVRIETGNRYSRWIRYHFDSFSLQNSDSLEITHTKAVGRIRWNFWRPGF